MLEKKYCHYCAHSLIKKYWEGRTRLFCERCNAPIYENPIPAVCVVVPDANDRIVLVQRSVAPKQGLWCLPGGFMELGETPEITALRELKEETGLSGAVVRLLGADANPSQLYHTVTLVCYEVRVTDGVLTPGDDAMAAGFYGKPALPEIAFSSHQRFIETYFKADS